MLVGGVRAGQNNRMAWQTAFRLIACAAALMLTGASAPSEPDPLAAALALPVAGDLTGARDAARFAWVENQAGARNVWVADRGKPARQVTAFAADDGQQLYDVVLNSDGTRIAFVRGGDEEFPDGSIPNTASATLSPKQQVFVGSADDAAPVAVGEGHSPAFAPDGARLAYTRKGAIWLWDGTTSRRLANVAGEVTRLQWSPDGTRLLFVDNRDDHSFVGLLDLAGTNVRYPDASFGFRSSRSSRLTARRSPLSIMSILLQVRPRKAALTGRCASPTPRAAHRAHCGARRRAMARAITARAVATCSGAWTGNSSFPGNAVAGCIPSRSMRQGAESRVT